MVGFDADFDLAAGSGELDGVREEVGEDLQDAVGVTVEVDGVGGDGEVEIERDLRDVGHGGHGFGGLLEEIAQAAATDVQGGAAGLHSFEIQDVVDEADEPVGVGDSDAQQVLRFGVHGAHQAGGEEAERAADAGERGAQLMRDGGDELVLDGVELGALGEEGVLGLLGFCGGFQGELERAICLADAH